MGADCFCVRALQCARRTTADGKAARGGSGSTALGGVVLNGSRERCQPPLPASTMQATAHLSPPKQLRFVRGGRWPAVLSLRWRACLRRQSPLSSRLQPRLSRRRGPELRSQLLHATPMTPLSPLSCPVQPPRLRGGGPGLALCRLRRLHRHCQRQARLQRRVLQGGWRPPHAEWPWRR